MATGTVLFQSGTIASPPVGLAVMADAVNHSTLGAGTAQFIKIMNGAVGGTAGVEATEANGLEVDVTRVQGTVQTLGSVQGVGTFQVLGSVQTVGTSQVLGTIQPLAGSVHVANVVFGTVQTHGTSQVLGTVQTHGTSQVLGTFQPLAGSVHLAAGSVNAQGVVANGGVAAGNPILFGAFGSSGTQAAVDDGDIVRLWTDLNGRLQVRGTIDSMPTVTVTGTVQTHGTSQVLGSVQTVGTSQVIGTFQSHGTNQALGTYQPLAGSVHVANTISGTVQTHGTSQVLGSVQAVGTTYTKEVRSNAPVGTRIAGTIGNLILLAANPNRLGAAFYLESGAPLFLKWGSLAGTFDYTYQLTAGALYELPYNYTGTISGIWQTANGTVQITEVT